MKDRTPEMKSEVVFEMKINPWKPNETVLAAAAAFRSKEDRSCNGYVSNQLDPKSLTSAYDYLVHRQKERSRSVVRSRQDVVAFLYKAIDYYKEDREIIQVTMNLLDRFLLRQYEHIHHDKKAKKRRMSKPSLLETSTKILEFQDLGVTALLTLDLAIKLFSPRSGRGSRVEKIQQAMEQYRSSLDDNDETNTSTNGGGRNQLQIDPNIYIGEQFYSMQLMGADTCSLQELTMLQSHIFEVLEFYLHPPIPSTFLKYLMELITPCHEEEHVDDCPLDQKMKTTDSRESMSSVTPSSCSISKSDHFEALASTSVHTTTPSISPDLVSSSSRSLPTPFDTTLVSHMPIYELLQNTKSKLLENHNISTPRMISDSSNATIKKETTSINASSSSSSKDKNHHCAQTHNSIDTIQCHARFQIECCTYHEIFALQKPSTIAFCALQNALQQIYHHGQKGPQPDPICHMVQDRLTRIAKLLGISTNQVEFRSHLYHAWERNHQRGPEHVMLGLASLEWPVIETITTESELDGATTMNVLVTPPSLMNEVDKFSKGYSASLWYNITQQTKQRKKDKESNTVGAMGYPRRSLRLLKKKREMTSVATIL